MKTLLNSICTATLLAFSVCVHAHDSANAPKSSPDFERLKSLVGDWAGQVDMGNGPVDMDVHYRLLAGGTVLEEKVFAGTPNEMVTMFYEKNGKVALTHYCLLGNRPAMTLKSSDGKSMRFDLDENCGINPATESHMHSLTLTFDQPGVITASCVSYTGGHPSEAHPTTLKRVKS
jgi:hypothetical protein